ncbi:MAG: tetratricopeptide repeat protein [Cyanothece sp. SIO1E1]|nr:tetratricopeptide repeat protein [Cyanothece sp. SIO1E1]
MLDSGRLSLSGEARLVFQSGLAAAANQDFEAAIADFDRALEMRPGCWEVWYERAMALESLGLYEQAIASYDAAVELTSRPKSAAEVWHSRGKALHYGLGQYDKAVESYEQALDIQPIHVMAWLNRGNALLYGLNQSQEAIASYDQVIEIDPEHDQAWRNRGNALAELGFYQEAIANYDQAIAVNPNDAATLRAKESALSYLAAEAKQPLTNPTWYGQGTWEDVPAYDGPETVIHHRLEIDESVSADSILSSSQTALLLVKDNQGERQIVLDQNSYTIGRDPENSICLHSQFASRCHATLTRLTRPDGTYVYEIRDGDGGFRQSTNGLIINGRRCKSWVLMHKDSVIFGPNVWLIYILPEDT